MKTTLSTSSEKIGNCDEILNDLRVLGIAADITKNVSIDQYGNVENRCRIMIPGAHSFHNSQVWEAVKHRYSLICAHLESSKFTRCVLDAYRKSNCPSNVDDNYPYCMVGQK